MSWNLFFKKDFINQNSFRVYKDLSIIFLSVIVAVMMVRTNALSDFLNLTREIKFLGSFLVGMFFVSFFTVAPAAVILVQLMLSDQIFEVAVFAGLGAVVGDFIIFKFFRDSFGEGIVNWAKDLMQKRSFEIKNSKTFKWLLPFLGAIIVASPLPDELGLMLMGLSKMPTQHFLIISFLLNFFGIFIIGLISRGLI